MRLSITDYEKIESMKSLLYRLRLKITKEDKKVLKKHKLLPGVEIYAIKIHLIKEINIARAIKVALRTILDYTDWYYKRSHLRIGKKPSYNNAIKEFKARGYIRASSLEDYLEKAGLPKSGGYVHSNRKIGGYIWVYPYRYATGYTQLLEGLTYIYQVFGLIGIQGYTKITTYD